MGRAPAPPGSSARRALIGPYAGATLGELVFSELTLFDRATPTVDPAFAALTRVHLDDRSWVDVVPDWLQGADTVAEELTDRLPWRQRRDVPMYDSFVDEPRLSSWWRAADGVGEPLPVLAEIRRLLSDRYRVRFDSIGFNLYRDGEDSVAWHGDRHRRHVVDPVVAIVSVGQARTLRLRPRVAAGPRRSQTWRLGHGHLFVMGGACQHEWEHCVPKSSAGVGPRISITFRHGAR